RAIAFLIINVAEAVLAHALALPPGKHARADGVACPPGKELGKNSHGLLRRFLSFAPGLWPQGRAYVQRRRPNSAPPSPSQQGQAEESPRLRRPSSEAEASPQPGSCRWKFTARRFSMPETT